MLQTSSREEIRKRSSMTTHCHVDLDNSNVTDEMQLGMKLRMLLHEQHNQPL